MAKAQHWSMGAWPKRNTEARQKNSCKCLLARTRFKMAVKLPLRRKRAETPLPRCIRRASVSLILLMKIGAIKPAAGGDRLAKVERSRRRCGGDPQPQKVAQKFAASTIRKTPHTNAAQVLPKTAPTVEMKCARLPRLHRIHRLHVVQVLHVLHDLQALRILHVLNIAPPAARRRRPASSR